MDKNNVTTNPNVKEIFINKVQKTAGIGGEYKCSKCGQTFDSFYDYFSHTC